MVSAKGAASDQAQQHVPLPHARGKRRAAVHRAHRKASKVEIAVVIHAGHLGGLSADQGAAGGLAAAGDPLDHAGALVDGQLAGGEIVQEEQRLGALADEVVHAHRDQVLAQTVQMSGDPFDQRVPRVDVDACVAIADPVLCHVGPRLMSAPR